MNHKQRINAVRGEKRKIITILTDGSCRMARVMNGTKLEMEGNYWDFHPGCHGIYKYGDFNRHYELVERMKQYYEKQGYIVTIKKKEYKFY